MANIDMHNPVLSLKRLLAFAGPAVPLAMLTTPVINYLPTFYVTEVGISLYWTGLAFMLANLWDGLTDVFIGSLSDRTKSRFGKRKIWMLIGILPLLISIYYLFNAPVGSGKYYLIIWISIFYVFWTVVQVPYLAWGAELTTSYSGRSRVFGFREMGTTIGIFLSAALPMLLLSSDAKMSEILRVLSYSIIGLLPILVFLSLYFVKERPHSTKPAALNGGLLSAIKTNKSYLRFLIYHFTFTLGVSIFNAVIVLFIQYRLGLENSFISLVFITYVAAIIGMPICVRYAHYFGRHRVLAVSVLLTSLSLVGMVFIPTVSYWSAATCFVLLGFSTSAAWAMPPAIVGDLSDLGNFKGYGEQTATYMAGFNLVYKLGMGLGVGIALPLLQYLGFQANSVVSSSNSLPLVLVCCIIPIIIMTASVALIWNFPINAHRHSIIRKGLNKRDTSRLRVGNANTQWTTFG
jgi:Na+/melibiose symporter-like transporter